MYELNMQNNDIPSCDGRARSFILFFSKLFFVVFLTLWVAPALFSKKPYIQGKWIFSYVDFGLVSAQSEIDFEDFIGKTLFISNNKLVFPCSKVSWCVGKNQSKWKLLKVLRNQLTGLKGGYGYREKFTVLELLVKDMPIFSAIYLDPKNKKIFIFIEDAIVIFKRSQ